MNEFDNRSKRWIRFTVDMFDHPALKSKEFDRCSAFAWLIANAAWKDHKVRMGNSMVEIKRGQVIVGLEHLSKEWGWGVKKVRLFLELLISEGMLEKGTSKGRFANIATICNYETYQTPQDQQGQVEGQVQDKLRAGSGQHSTKDTNIPNKNNYTSHLESAREQDDGATGRVDCNFDSDLAQVAARCLKQVGHYASPRPTAFKDFDVLEQAIAGGLKLETDILPAIRHVLKTTKGIVHGWKYFEKEFQRRIDAKELSKKNYERWKIQTGNAGDSKPVRHIGPAHEIPPGLREELCHDA